MSCTRPCVCVWLTAHFSSFLRSFLIVSKRNEVLIGLMMEPATGQSWDECRPSIHPNSINNGPRSLSTCPSLPPSTPPPNTPSALQEIRGYGTGQCASLSLSIAAHILFSSLFFYFRGYLPLDFGFDSLSLAFSLPFSSRTWLRDASFHGWWTIEVPVNRGERENVRVTERMREFSDFLFVLSHFQ